MLHVTAEDVGTRETALADRIARAKELRARKCLYKDIATELGVTAYTARLYCNNP